MPKRIMILAGGTGGHVFPALAVAENLRLRGHEVHWMGTRSGLEARIVPDNGFSIDWLPVSGFRGKSGFHKIKAVFMVLRACWQARRIFACRKPDVVLGMGGFAAGPGGLMAWLKRIPLVIHEQNRIPGTTNRLLAALAHTSLEAFPGSFKKSAGAVCTGNPLRAAIAGLEPAKPYMPATALRILIIGGSQGARILNEIVPGAISLLGCRVELLHQTGVALLEQTRDAYRKLGIKVQIESFIEDMASTYRWADLVICRAGAMTVSELAAAGLAAILVPFPYAIDDHQTHNARYLVDAGAALLLDQKAFSEQRLAHELQELLADIGRIQSMSQAARRLARPDAAQVVADYCLQEAA